MSLLYIRLYELHYCSKQRKTPYIINYEVTNLSEGTQRLRNLCNFLTAILVINLETLVSYFPFLNVDLDITVVSVLQNTLGSTWGGRRHISLLTYLLTIISIFAHNYLFILALALEFARCPYRILQINYVDVDVENSLN